MDKMYSLIIVDDEMTIRKGMCNYIDWESMGFSVAADFEDGKEALDFMQDHAVDIVLTDIEMAEVNGFEIARYVFENELPTKIVILSGYKEFEYAKQAIKYNVEEYLLKPIQLDELEQVFRRIYGKLQEEEKDQEEKSTQEKDFAEIVPELQEQFWMGILLGGVRGKKLIIEKRQLLHLDFSTNTPCAVASVRLHVDAVNKQHYFHQRSNRYNLLNNIFSEAEAGLHFYPVYLPDDQLKLIITTKEKLPQFEEKLNRQLMQKLHAIETFMNLKIEVEVEKCFGNIADLADYYSTQQMSVRPHSGEKYSLNEAYYERLLRKYQLLMDTINSGDIPDLDRLMNDLMYELHGLPLDEMKELLTDLFSMILQKYMKVSTKLWKEMRREVHYAGIITAADREELRNVCGEMLRKIMEITRRQQKEVSRNMIDKIIRYMQEHYDEDISLDLLAEKYYLNASYLSRLFKQHTGTNMIDTLSEIRIEKAKALLLTRQYKVYEVSRMVGYRSEKYFSRIFKQYCGLSPSDYCRSELE